MPPPGEGLGAAAEGADSTGATAGPDLDPEGKLGRGSGGYVPPHLRKGAAGATGEKMAGGSKYERDDLATLRVTNVSEFAEEGDLREIFERYGRVTRVFLAKDRESGRAKGFAFISYADRADAQRACDKIDGCKCSFLFASWVLVLPSSFVWRVEGIVCGRLICGVSRRVWAFDS